VRLRPQRRADILDLALEGRAAEVVAVEEDLEGRVHVAVTLADDTARDLGTGAQIGHRFYFAPEDLEALDEPAGGPAEPRVLVAGIGNIFLGDDAFGPEVAAALLGRPRPPGVYVADFGIRGMDLAYALADGYDAAVLVDAAPRGQQPGTLYVIEPEMPADDTAPETHGMDPVRVLALARRLGGAPPRILVVGCEPGPVPAGEDPDLASGLSPAVRLAVKDAVRLVETVVEELLADLRAAGERRTTPCST
jgi:hydrogenase maturation protease